MNGGGYDVSRSPGRAGVHTPRSLAKRQSGTVAETEDFFGASEKILERGADWITFTSGSTVEFFHGRFDLPKLLKKFPQMKIASIGPETSKAISVLGLKPAIEAKEHTTDGLIEVLLRAAKA